MTTIGNDELKDVTIDGDIVEEITVDGDLVYERFFTTKYQDETTNGASNSFTAYDTHFYFEHILNEFQDESKSDSSSIRVGTGVTIDVTNTENVFIDWESSVEYSSWASNVSDCRCAVGNSQSEIVDKNTSHYISKSGGFSRQLESFSVSNLNGEQYIGVGLDASSTEGEKVDLTVYQIYGEDSNGNELWNLNIGKSYR
jgi:hypothetical protein